jgi:hypothetical protein
LGQTSPWSLTTWIFPSSVAPFTVARSRSRA